MPQQVKLRLCGEALEQNRRSRTIKTDEFILTVENVDCVVNRFAVALE
jgi:hypothetical protein